MGRVKSLMIKRAASQLMEDAEVYTTDFEFNKKLLKNKMPSKSIRNKVAGQIVRLVRQKQKHENDRRADKDKTE